MVSANTVFSIIKFCTTQFITSSAEASEKNDSTCSSLFLFLLTINCFCKRAARWGRVYVCVCVGVGVVGGLLFRSI